MLRAVHTTFAGALTAAVNCIRILHSFMNFIKYFSIYLKLILRGYAIEIRYHYRGLLMFDIVTKSPSTLHLLF